MLVSSLTSYQYAPRMQVRNSFRGNSIIYDNNIIPDKSWIPCKKLDTETINKICQELSANRAKDPCNDRPIFRMLQVVRQVEKENHGEDFNNAVKTMIEEERKINNSASNGIIKKLEKIQKFNGRFDLKGPWANIEV